MVPTIGHRVRRLAETPDPQARAGGSLLPGSLQRVVVAPTVLGRDRYLTEWLVVDIERHRTGQLRHGVAP